MKIHIVQKGDTLWKLAKKYGVSFEELKKVNTQLSNPDMMMPGMKIKIPGTSGAVIKETGKPNVNIQPGMKESQILPYQAQPAPMKEQQIMQKPAVKEQPKFQQPVKEQPKFQQPVKEQPKFQQPVKEQPKFQQPVKEQPIVEKPKKEQQIIQPKPIIKEKEKVVPKEMPVPMPVIPEIDVNNYYMVNMTNMSVQKPPAPPPLPKKKEEPAVTKKKKKKPAVQSAQDEPVDDCIPVTPILPGSGYCIQPPPWAQMHMQGMQAPYQGVQGYQAAPEMHGYQMMEESSDIWGESPDMPMMDQGFVQGASMNAPSQQYYPYQASAPVPHHYYGGMNQQPQAGSYMQQDYESSGESPSYNQNFPQFSQTAGEEEEDCGCNKGLLGTYGPEVKGQYQGNQGMDANAHHHPDYHQYQSVQSQQQAPSPGMSPKESQMGMDMQYPFDDESVESEAFMMMDGQNGGQPPGMMMGGQNGGQPPGMMMGGQNGGQPPGMMMGGQNGGQPGMMGGQNGGQPWMMGGQNGGQPWMMGGQNGGQPWMMGGQNGGQPGMMGGQNGGQPGMMMGGQNGGQPGMMPGQFGGQPDMMRGQLGGQPEAMLPGQMGGQPGQFGGVRAPETFGIPTYVDESDDY
ncbi:SafA/ExsA family spore coat assembly protein [Peribacillus frigoritolerans]|uniref:SafA/ExsA family spore coat assembly protein n=1 Tax=Peribacillus frigoritolerans TaxID=450367 RepID=UPI00209C87DA|nr:SafA/ExsA family spore coat assembly protein [Peribacillus frigoritolerans]MCP1154248.1 SafA/ExsA family spore coat assembly protein [Peribacillus frigoritolerans]